MVGVMILGIVFAAAFAAMNQGFYMAELARDNTRTSQILQSEMENLRTLNWDGLIELENSDTFTPDSTVYGRYEERYTYKRSITANKTGQREVLLAINWTDKRGVKHTQSYMTYFSEDGLNDFYYRSL